MDKETLYHNIKKKKSFLCVGLDSDREKIPVSMYKEKDPLFSFNKKIVDATAKYCIAYKPNLAFYESSGPEGIESLKKTVSYIRRNYPDQFLIADAKRGDIGNTSAQYAREIFGYFDFDAVTLSPYMGEDSVSPFLEYKDKWVILLALTSNKSASDFQFMQDGNGEYLFERVLRISKTWGTPENLMYVVGATQSDNLKRVRRIVPDHFLLVPGIGAQGGNLKETVHNGMNKVCGLIVNSSRKIIFSDHSENFAEHAEAEARKIQEEMFLYLNNDIDWKCLKIQK